MNKSKARRIESEIEEVNGLIRDMYENFRKVQTTAHGMEAYGKLVELKTKLDILREELGENMKETDDYCSECERLTTTCVCPDD